MKVYHGTDYKYLDKILNNGITPRYHNKRVRKGNWDSMPSHKKMVYTSTAYPWYYAVNAQFDLKKGVVFEIDLEALDESNLYPDEDFVWQAMKREIPDLEHSYISENLDFYQYLWRNSLKFMGNVCHKGTIPLSAMTRYCIINFDLRKQLCFEMLQPCLIIENYQICGKQYQDLNAWCFGDIEILPFYEKSKQLYEMFKDQKPEGDSTLMSNAKESMKLWKEESENRNGIEVVNLQESI